MADMNLRIFALATVYCLPFCCSAAALAAPDDWAEGTAERDDGATPTYYNRGAQLPWRNRAGDWRDADGVEQGIKPFAVAAIGIRKHAQPIEWDVTFLVRDWVSGKARNKGVLLRNTKDTGTFVFHSREADQAADRPQLVLTVNGKRNVLEAVGR
jgi:hypothetical protein